MKGQARPLCADPGRPNTHGHSIFMPGCGSPITDRRDPDPRSRGRRRVGCREPNQGLPNG
jgi:hypothetical protein